MARVLIVDDNAVFARQLARCLEARSVVVCHRTHGSQIPGALQEGIPDVVVIESVIPGLSGIRLLDHVRERCPVARIVVVSARANVETAVEVMKRGAVDYLVKPLSPEVVAETVCGLISLEAPPAPRELDVLLGDCQAMTDLRMLIERVAVTDTPVLVSGESGTGKELVARALHRQSGRRDQPFVAVNCGALAEGLLDSELFGHVPGAFTGARSGRLGLFAEADGGVIFLDELASTSRGFQVKLLRVLEDGLVRPVGGASNIRTDLRVIAAVNVDLEAAVRRGRFRADLYYRLNVVPLRLPPLRDRGADIAQLAEHFTLLASHTLNKARPSIASGVHDALSRHPWPGNVRELRNVMERAVLLADNEVRLEHLPPEMHACAVGRTPNYTTAKEAAVRRFQIDYVRRLMARFPGRVSEAAVAAGIPRQTLHRLLRELSRESDEVPDRESEAKSLLK